MTKEEIIEIIIEMVMHKCDRSKNDSPALKMFVSFAKLVAEREREECANLCWKDDDNNAFVNAYHGKRLDLLCSELIRARGQE
jgi:hypothetical protein